VGSFSCETWLPLEEEEEEEDELPLAFS